LDQVPGIDKGPASAGQPDTVAAWSNQLAQTVSTAGWSTARSQEVLAALAGTSDSFRDTGVSQADQAERAQRLVLALDRLLKATHPLAPYNPMKPPPQPAPVTGDAEMGALFHAAEDPKNFDAKGFADLLHKFAEVVAPK
jgi:hypothetical protein